MLSLHFIAGAVRHANDLKGPQGLRKISLLRITTYTYYSALRAGACISVAAHAASHELQERSKKNKGDAMTVKIFTTGNPFAPGLPDLSALKRQAAEWEASQAIDMVLIGYSALWPQNFVTASMIFAVTERLGLIVAHRPGVMHAASGSRAFATMDFLSGGDRIAVNLVSGSSDKDLHREGDYLPKAERYARATGLCRVHEACVE